MLADEVGGGTRVNRTRVYEGSAFGFDEVTVEYEGERLLRQWIVHPGSVVVLALDEDDRVVVLQQYRAPLDARCWELPAGLLDVAGEDPLDAAKRELAEEVDLVAAEWSTLAKAAPTGGSSDEIFTVFLATDLSPANSDYQRTGEEAHMRVTRVPFEELLEAVLHLGICNAALQLGVLALDARRRRGLQPPSVEAPRSL